MLKVQEVSRLTGVSVRALHHYDQIGLLPPTQVTEAGYRLYDEESLVRLQLIMLYRTLEFPLKDIKRILDSPDFDRNKALDQQLTLLKLRREHLDNLIALTQGIRLWGVKHVSFEAFDTTKIEQYTAEARASWGQTDAWREYEQKRARRDAAEEARIGKGMMTLMASFGALRGRSPSDPEVQARVQALRDKLPFLEGKFSIHLIGQLQSNKVKYIIKDVCLIHSLDHASLAQEIDRQAQKAGIRMPVLIQVNIAREPQKGGIAEEEVFPFLRECARLPGLWVKGLMTMMPLGATEEEIVPLFTRMRALLDQCREEAVQGTDMTELSMGMSQDYALAARCGATMVRVGSALFR